MSVSTSSISSKNALSSLFQAFSSQKPPVVSPAPKQVSSAAAAKKPASLVPASSVKPKSTAPVVPKPTAPASTSVSLSKGLQAPAPELYAKNGAMEKAVPQTSASGSFVAGATPVVVDIMNSESGFSNKIFWSTDNFATRNYLGIDNETGSFNIGSFAPGTKIDFGIENDGKEFFRTGSASQNQDNFQHTRVTKTAAGMQIGFEDLYGGGDKDFNDALINVRSATDAQQKPFPAEPAVPPVIGKNDGKKTSPVAANPAFTPPARSPEVPAKSVTPAKPDSPQNNRSGLSDGSNPGQGSGKLNSPNTGINNPNNAAKSATKSILRG